GAGPAAGEPPGANPRRVLAGPHRGGAVEHAVTEHEPVERGRPDAMLEAADRVELAVGPPYAAPGDESPHVESARGGEKVVGPDRQRNDHVGFAAPDPLAHPAPPHPAHHPR